MSRSVVDSGALELVRAGLITYRQLNEVHKIVQETGGGDIHSVLLDKGYVTQDQLRGRRRGQTRRRLKLTYSLDLVKAGMLTFRQLNECHRKAREAENGKTILDMAVEAGYVTELQLATLPKEGSFAEKDKHNKRFSSSWDLFRAGLVNLRALNECHRQIKVGAPEKSLKEALIERGYVTAEQVAELANNPVAESTQEAPSAFMEKYADELESIPAELRSRLRREHLASRGIEASEDEPARWKPATGRHKRKPTAAELAPSTPEPEPPAADPGETVAASILAESDEAEAGFRAAKTFMDMGEEEDEEAEEEAEFRAAKTFMDMDEEEEEPEEETEFRAAKTFMDMGEEEEEEEEDADFRAAKTFMDMGDEEDEEEEAGHIDLRSAKTFMDMGDDDAAEVEEDADFRAARTFMDMGDDEEDEEGEDADFRAAKTFMSMDDEEAEEEEDGDFRAAKTFMSMDDEEADEDGDFRAAKTFMSVGEEEEAAEDAQANTFMDMGGDLGGESQGPRTFMDLKADTGFQSQATFLEGVTGAPNPEDDSQFDGQTFMDIAGSGGGKDSGFESDMRTSSKVGDEDGTFMDLGAAGGADSKFGSKTEVGSGTEVGNTSGTSSKSGTSNSSVGSQTEADTAGGQTKKKKKKKKKKKDDDDAYSHPLVGKVIGGCRIVKKLGEGGMGAVFLAEHTRLKRQSVIKVIPAHLSSNRQLIARFQREAQAAAVIQHPNVVNVFNVGEENGVHFIEMEYVDGSGLDGLMKKKKVIPQMEAVRIIKECCRGLAEAHKHGIVHRDIKPDNIMLTRKGQVKIADFGLARAASEGQAELTKVGQILGTPAYMSPEQCQGKPTDHRCDIYSLGATFYAMVTGKRPFTGKSVMEIMQKHIDEQPISPREYNPDLSVRVAQTILKMMAKKVEDRSQSGDEVNEALDQFLKEEGTEHLEEVQRALGDRYRIIKKLGQGGMGAVYSAKVLEDTQTAKAGEVVAIKVLTQDVGEEEVERFRMEAELAQKVDHPNIIRVLEFEISKAINFIVMEYVEGESVRDVIRDKKVLPEAEVLRIIKASALGLMAAHDQDIVHRDIKPDNIMLAKDGRVKIADFGVAKHTEAQSELTQAGFLVGTPHYMSPEQCSGESEVPITTRADIYSLGATAYFMATGVKPFEGDTQPTILLQHMKTPAKPPHEVNEQLSQGISNVVLNMMAKRPERRYATLKEVLAELDKVEKGQVPKKRRGIDDPFGEAAATKRNVVLVLVAIVLLLGVGFLVNDYQKNQAEQNRIAAAQEKRDNAQAGMSEAYETGRDEIGRQIKARMFNLADARLTATRDKIQLLDYTDQMELVAQGGYAEKLSELEDELGVERKKRDEQVERFKTSAQNAIGVFESELKAFHTQLDAEEKRVAEANRVVDTTVRTLVEPRNLKADPVQKSTQALLFLYEMWKDPERKYGDTPAREEWANAKRKEIRNDLQGAGRRLLDAMWRSLEDGDYLGDLQYFHEANRLLARFTEKWPAAIKVDTRAERQWSLELTVGNTALERVSSVASQEEKLSKQHVVVRNKFFLAEGFLRGQRELVRAGKEPYMNYVKLLRTYGEVRDLADSTSKHAMRINERYNKLDKDRNALALNLRNRLADRAQELVAKKLYRDAINQLTKGKAELNKVYSSSAADKQQRADVEKGLEDGIAEITRNVISDWQKERSGIEQTAWGERRFLEAERRLTAIVDPPKELAGQREIPLPKANKSDPDRTIVDDARDLLNSLAFNLSLLREGATAYGVRVPKGTYPIGWATSRYPNERPGYEELLGAFVIDRFEVKVGDYKQFLETTRDGKPGEVGSPGYFTRRHRKHPVFCHKDEPDSEFGHCPPYLLRKAKDGSIAFEVKTDAKGREYRQYSWRDGVEVRKPVHSVSWYDAFAFAKWAGKALASEQEWEVAASCEFTGSGAERVYTGKKWRYPWGWLTQSNAFDRDRLGSAGAQQHDVWSLEGLPLGGSNTNARASCGAQDMAGSLWEWCGSNYVSYKNQDRRIDPDFGPRFRVVRGGAFSDFYEFSFRATFRNRALPTDRRATIGFRCVRRIKDGK